MTRPESAAVRRPWLTAAVLVGLLTVLVGIGEPAAAQSPQIDRLIEGPAIQGDDAPTVAERYPVTHYRYPFYGEGLGIGSRSTEMLDQAINALASLLMLGAGLLAQAASKLVQWAFDPTTTAWLLDAVDATVGALGDSIYGQAVLVAVMLGVLWVAWRGIARQEATSALQGGIWMVAVVAVGVAFLSQPRWFIETPHEVTTELTAGLFGAVAGVGTDGGADGYHGDTPPTFSGPSAVDAQRQLEDQLWRVMVYEPWRISTFPSADLADEYGEDLLADRSEENVQDIYEQIRADDEVAAEFFAGREPLDRLVASGMTLLAALPIAITMIVLGAALIVLQFAFVILSLLAPVFLLLGIHPGGGRNALLRWLDMWLGTLVKRVAVTALISVLVALFAFASSNLGQQGWYLTVLLTTLVCVAALVYRKTITELLASAAGSVGAGTEGERGHRSRAHPVQTVRRTTGGATRAVKFMSAGALMSRAARPDRQDHQPADAPRSRPGTSTSRRPSRTNRGGGVPSGGTEEQRRGQEHPQEQPEPVGAGAASGARPDGDRRQPGRPPTSATATGPVAHRRDRPGHTARGADAQQGAPPGEPTPRAATDASRQDGHRDADTARRESAAAPHESRTSRRPERSRSRRPRPRQDR